MNWQVGRRIQDRNRRTARRAWHRQDARANVNAAREDPLRDELWAGRWMPQTWTRSASRGVTKVVSRKCGVKGGNKIIETEYIGQDGKEEEEYRSGHQRYERGGGLRQRR